MTLGDVPIGMPFRFTDDRTVYIHQGDGSYCLPGPLPFRPPPQAALTTSVKETAGVLHSHSFDGFDEPTMRAVQRRVCHTHRHEYTEGDRALVRYKFTCRGMVWPDADW